MSYISLTALLHKWRQRYLSDASYGEVNETVSRAYRDCADELESILAAPQPAPAGMVLVPRVMTLAMEDAWFDAKRHDENGELNFQLPYSAMLAAAPAAEVADCPTCEKDGVWATDGAGPFDCYACGKKAAAQVAVSDGWEGPVDREQLANWIHRKMTDLAVEYRKNERLGEDLRMIVGGMIPVYYAPPKAAAPAVVVDEFKPDDRVVVRSLAGIVSSGVIVRRNPETYDVFLDSGIGITAQARDIAAALKGDAS